MLGERPGLRPSRPSRSRPAPTHGRPLTRTIGSPLDRAGPESRSRSSRRPLRPATSFWTQLRRSTVTVADVSLSSSIHGRSHRPEGTASPERGGGKALWTIFVIFLPFIGILSYLIARGHKMSEHAVADAQAQQDYFKQQVQSAVGSGNSASELSQLAELKSQGVISDDEFQAMKAKIVSA